ncbi:MAG: hypothetical protein AAGD96_35025 [Chloroflexota bacterium]
MKLSAPTQPIFLIAVALAVLAIVGSIVTVPYLTAYGFWILLAAFVILVLGNIMKGV